MTLKYRRLRALLDPWIDRVEAFRQDIEYALRNQSPRLLRFASDQFVSSVNALSEFVQELLSSPGWRSNPGSAPDLSEMVFEFVRLRDAAEKNEVTAGKMAGLAGRRAKSVIKAARKSSEITRAFARALKAEMERSGVWNDEFAASLGILEWLS